MGSKVIGVSGDPQQSDAEKRVEMHSPLGAVGKRKGPRAAIF